MLNSSNSRRHHTRNSDVIISVSGPDVFGRRQVAEEIATGRPTAAIRDVITPAILTS